MRESDPRNAFRVLLCCAVVSAAAGVAVARESAEQTLAAAQRQFDRKNYGAARSLAARVVARDPKSSAAERAWLVVIDCRMKQGHLRDASEECERMLAAHPETKHHSAVLRREFVIGEALTTSRVKVLLFNVTALRDGVSVLEKVIAHAPFGPLADDAVYAIGEAYYRAEDYPAARDQYDRLLKQYPKSELVIRARVRRSACNAKLTEGAPYDLQPVEDARKDIEVLVRLSGNEQLAAQAGEMRDLLAQGDYEAGLFYFRMANIEAGVRYMKAVRARYPKSEYAERARRVLLLIAEAEGEELP